MLKLKVLVDPTLATEVATSNLDFVLEFDKDQTFGRTDFEQFPFLTEEQTLLISRKLFTIKAKREERSKKTYCFFVSHSRNRIILECGNEKKEIEREKQQILNVNDIFKITNDLRFQLLSADNSTKRTIKETNSSETEEESEGDADKKSKTKKPRVQSQNGNSKNGNVSSSPATSTSGTSPTTSATPSITTSATPLITTPTTPSITTPTIPTPDSKTKTKDNLIILIGFTDSNKPTENQIKELGYEIIDKFPKNRVPEVFVHNLTLQTLPKALYDQMLKKNCDFYDSSYILDCLKVKKKLGKGGYKIMQQGYLFFFDSLLFLKSTEEDLKLIIQHNEGSLNRVKIVTTKLPANIAQENVSLIEHLRSRNSFEELDCSPTNENDLITVVNDHFTKFRNFYRFYCLITNKTTSLNLKVRISKLVSIEKHLKLFDNQPLNSSNNNINSN
eukprot:TRINITY_DN1773_c0_g1_i3.p1 TRINITY_DN1773_c0_g1~~TRINITY_DN1773_c0_g1_i3.p1  ORF type:complete len:446 (-),score=150.46 TRINITY_DN1773_c0_g1_i3:125-1462(-)